MELLIKEPMKKVNRTSKPARDEQAVLSHPSNELQILLKKERARSDRTGLPFSQILFECEEMGRSVSEHFMRLVYSRIRLADEARLVGRNNIAVVLPDTSADGARALADNILNLLQADNLAITCKVFSYPSLRFDDEE